MSFIWREIFALETEILIFQLCFTCKTKLFLIEHACLPYIVPSETDDSRFNSCEKHMLKMEAPNDFFVPCFSAGSKQRVQGPQKRNPKTKKTARPQSLKRRGSKSRPANTNFFVPLGKGLQKAIARPEIHRVQKISKFAANCYILKDR